MGRKRKKGSHLPERMYHHKGTYYLVEHDGKWINLGKKLPTALAQYHKLVQSDNTINNMGDLIDRYMIEISPTKKESTYKSEIAAAKFLRAGFHEFRPSDVTPQAIYQYMDFRSKTAPVRVNREIALLSHMFKKAIRWGAVTSNPCHDVERNPEQPRDRYVTDEELSAFQEFIPEWLALYLDLKLLTGLRQTDLLQLKFDAFNNDGLLIRMSKTERSTRKQLLIEWTDELRQTVEAIRGLPGKIKSLHLFSTRQGQPYTPDGFRSIWHRWMTNALKKEILTERFQERDIRAKTGSDIEQEHATLLLGHESGKTTVRHYRRLATKVKPLK